ncbi:MAG: rod-binding protein [Thermoanaerobacteraceae bacterium]
MEINPINNMVNLQQINIQKSGDNFERAIKDALNDKNKEKLKEECKNLESQFVSIMLNEMKKTIPKDPLTGDDFATDVFTSMLYDKYSEVLTQNSSFGLAEEMYKQLSKNI